MNSLSKVFLTLTFISSACNSGNGKKSGSPEPTPTTDQKAQCVEAQKKALTDAGLSLAGELDEIKKLTQKSPEFYATLPYCSN